MHILKLAALSACPVRSTLSWIRDVVVDLRLCPWAGKALVTDLRVVACDADDILGASIREMERLSESSSSSSSAPRGTTMLALPPMTFDEFLDVAARVDVEIDDRWRGTIQLATFHPDYRFANSEGKDDPADYTNRSPFPVLHFLLEDEVTAALEAYGREDADAIWRRNKALTRRLGLREMRRRLLGSFISEEEEEQGREHNSAKGE